MKQWSATMGIRRKFGRDSSGRGRRRERGRGGGEALLAQQVEGAGKEREGGNCDIYIHHIASFMFVICDH